MIFCGLSVKPHANYVILVDDCKEVSNDPQISFGCRTMSIYYVKSSVNGVYVSVCMIMMVYLKKN